jgi:2-polyprenyl-3-methyl-5-hydroxy-6-metoxy-1,4-benzoquinol methylase
LTELDLSGWEGAYDVITLWDVLEHLPEPRPHLEVIRRLLRPKGILALSTPNMEGLTLRLLGKRSRVFSPHEHLVYYSKRTLTDLLKSCGFRILRVQTQGIYLHNLMTLLTRQSKTQPCRVQSRYHHAYQRLQGRMALRFIRLANLGLRLTGVGDSLIAFARKP